MQKQETNLVSEFSLYILQCLYLQTLVASLTTKGISHHMAHVCWHCDMKSNECWIIVDKLQ